MVRSLFLSSKLKDYILDLSKKTVEIYYKYNNSKRVEYIEFDNSNALKDEIDIFLKCCLNKDFLTNIDLATSSIFLAEKLLNE